jgi:FkbM family methyltransferase
MNRPPKNLKLFFRELLPSGFQVPVKYWYSWCNATLEPELKLLHLLVRPGDHVVDVGGNRGIYTYRLWKLGARVEVFEPNPACVSVLRAWATRKPEVHVHPVGLSNREGSASLRIPVDGNGVEHDASASLEPAGFERARDEQITIRTLDSYAFDQVKLIKIDVEGHESSVLEGAKMTLAASRPALLVEIEQRHCIKPIDEVFKQVLSQGYRGFYLIESRLLPLVSFGLAFHQSVRNFGVPGRLYINNFIFLPWERLDRGEYRELFGAGQGT